MKGLRLILSVLLLLCLCMGATSALAIDVTKTTNPKIIKPSEQTLKKYTVKKNKKYSTKVKKSKKLSMKKLEKQKKKSEKYQKNRGNQKKSKFDGVINDTQVTVVSDQSKIDVETVSDDFTVDSMVDAKAIKVSKPKKKKKVTQGEINEFSQPGGDKESPVKVTPAGGE